MGGEEVEKHVGFRREIQEHYCIENNPHFVALGFELKKEEIAFMPVLSTLARAF